MSFTRFLLLDGLGVLVSVPTSIWVAKLFFKKFGEEIDGAAKKVSEFNHIVLAGVVVLVIVLIIRKRVKKKRALSAALAAAAVEGAVAKAHEPPTAP
jgi:membrane protein DedA with SNARE-associated domain